MVGDVGEGEREGGGEGARARERDEIYVEPRRESEHDAGCGRADDARDEEPFAAGHVAESTEHWGGEEGERAAARLSEAEEDVCALPVGGVEDLGHKRARQRDHHEVEEL